MPSPFNDLSSPLLIDSFSTWHRRQESDVSVSPSKKINYISTKTCREIDFGQYNLLEGRWIVFSNQATHF